MELEFGAFAAPIAKQLAETYLSVDDLKYIDKVNDAIERLRIGGFIPPATVHKARLKLIKVIEKREQANRIHCKHCKARGMCESTEKPGTKYCTDLRGKV